MLETSYVGSPRVGDRVLICDDVLAEVARHVPGLQQTWRFVPAGSTGRLLGWRGQGRAIVDVHGGDGRLVVFMASARLAT